MYVIQSDVENGESSPPDAAVSPSPSVAPLNPEVILREEEEVNVESEAAAARKAFGASLQPIKVLQMCSRIVTLFGPGQSVTISI